MRSSGIGGQAVLEGVMMRHKNEVAVAVRKPDGTIKVAKQRVRSPKDICKAFGWPIIRGVASFISSLVIGIKTLTYSANIYAEDEETEKSDNSKSESAIMFGTVAFSLIFAVAIFMILPYAAANGILKLAKSDSAILLAVIEGVIKLGIFIAYISLISLMKDIKRTYMYHGSEHKCINCIEGGNALTVDNVMKASKEHRRCGTSFIFFVLFLSIILFVILDAVLNSIGILDTSNFVNKIIRMGFRLLLVPLIAGLSFEFIQWTGNSDLKIAGILSKPGLWIQALTTKEPDRDMVEVAIASVEAVFDWRGYLKEEGIDDDKPDC